MRKKLFAVIMSAMMMITFMPAMAFADITVDVPATTGNYITVSGVTTWASDAATSKAFFYDGAEHTVTYVKPVASWTQQETETVRGRGEHHGGVTYFPLYEIDVTKTYTVDKAKAATVEYNVLPQNKWNGASWEAATGVTWSGWSTTAPVIKNAGKYTVKVQMTYVDPATGVKSTILSGQADITINKRPVVVKGVSNVHSLVKDYDAKPFVVDDNTFVIANKVTATMSADDTAYWTARSGLVAGDKLFTKAYETGVNAGIYKIQFSAVRGVSDANVNANYTIDPTSSISTAELFVAINKADNAAKIASNTLTVKRGYSKAVKFSATFGTAKLTKLSGNTKISVKSGKIVVKKSCKKGTYKIKVKAAVAGNANYASASRVKTLTIKVK